MGYVFVAITITATVAGQLLVKWGMDSTGQLPERPLAAFFRLVRVMLGNPRVFTGLLCAFIGMLAWMGALTKLPLSTAYPFVALSYVFVMLAAARLFGEPVSKWRWMGIVLIAIGVALAGRG